MLPPVHAFPDSEFIRVLKARKTHRQFSNKRSRLKPYPSCFHWFGASPAIFAFSLCSVNYSIRPARREARDTLAKCM